VTLALAGTLASLGFAGSFVAGFIGVGGAILMVPMLYYVPPLLGLDRLDIKDVAGLTMTQVLVASTLGALTHGRSVSLHRRLAVRGGAAMALGALVGGIGSHYVGGRALLILFACMATLALPLLVLAPTGEVAEPAAAARADGLLAVVLPLGIGLAAGMVGAGGAFLLMPVLVGVLRVPIRQSIGTSLAMTGLAALMGFAGKAATGQIALGPALALVSGALPGAPLGARLSRRAPVGLLRGCLVVLVALVAVRVWLDVFRH
jgi:uncharacterized membrane protein YfcA